MLIISEPHDRLLTDKSAGAGAVDEIERLFGILGYNIQDYHNETSNCKDATGVENGIGDDIKGLINFVRGKDYFDYDGDCLSLIHI